MNPADGTCPQCTLVLPSPRPSLCPRCHYPLLLAEDDQDDEAVAADLRRPTGPVLDDQTVIVPAPTAAPRSAPEPPFQPPVAPYPPVPEPVEGPPPVAQVPHHVPPPAPSRRLPAAPPPSPSRRLPAAPPPSPQRVPSYPPVAEPVAGPAATGGMACPSCGWQNDPGRQRCERCAAQLRAPQVARHAPVAPPPARPRRAGWLIALAVVAVLALGVGAAVFFLRPGTQAPPPGTRRTPAAAVTTASPPRPAGPLVQIATGRITVAASTVLPPAPPYRYDPEQLLDGDTTTAWNSNGTAGGQPIEVTFTFDGPVALGRIDVANGYQSNDDAYSRNRRVKRLLVVTDSQQIPLDLADSQGFQQFERPFGETRKVVLRIESHYPGSRYEDIALSEVRFFVHS